MAYRPSFRTTLHEGFWLAVILATALAVCYPAQVQSEGQKGTPKFEVDPTWPKPLPNRWINGQVSGVCADRQDHIFIVNRNDITDEEKENGVQSPPVIDAGSVQPAALNPGTSGGDFGISACCTCRARFIS